MPSSTRDRTVPWPTQTASPSAPTPSSSMHKIRRRRSPPPQLPRRANLDARDGDHIVDQAAIGASSFTPPNPGYGCVPSPARACPHNLTFCDRCCREPVPGLLRQCRYILLPQLDHSCRFSAARVCKFCLYVFRLCTEHARLLTLGTGNSRLPEFVQTNLVNIYLLSATEDGILLQWNNITNPTGNAGVHHAQVNDSWWGSRGNEWDGTNVPFLFQWAITRADKTLDGTVTRQAIFTGLRK